MPALKVHVPSVDVACTSARGPTEEPALPATCPATLCESTTAPAAEQPPSLGQ